MSCSSSSLLLLASAAAILLSFACASSMFRTRSPALDSAPAPKVSSAVLSAQGSGEVLSPVGEVEKA